jgi:hypothetical protein
MIPAVPVVCKLQHWMELLLLTAAKLHKNLPLQQLLLVKNLLLLPLAKHLQCIRSKIARCQDSGFSGGEDRT